jgi:hypothetical protein
VLEARHGVALELPAKFRNAERLTHQIIVGRPFEHMKDGQRCLAFLRELSRKEKSEELARGCP